MKDDTKIVQAGRLKADGDVPRDVEVVNPPVYHASTVLFPDLSALSDPKRAYTYGRHGTPTTRALEAALCALEGGVRTMLVPSGLNAITTALLCFAKMGNHILVADSVYSPTRVFCDRFLTRFGIEVEYYDPRLGDIATLFRPNTSVVFCESPGSQTFEIQDLPAIAAAARPRGIIVMSDNTWASPLFYKPLPLGAHLSIQSATKYIAGHSDVMLGAITADAETAPALVQGYRLLGQAAAPDDVYATLRGLRTLSVRMARHQENGLALARWFQARPEVDRVLHPALESFPGHPIWKRDFSGASGTFSVVLKPCSTEAVAALVEGLELFGLGYSFGGYESLVMPADPRTIRTATRWQSGPLVRFHVGFEDVDDLVADLTAGFARLTAKESRK